MSNIFCNEIHFYRVYLDIIEVIPLVAYSAVFVLQTLALIQENESLKHRLRQADGLELERDELVRQLEMAKEDLFNEQKQARHKVEELKDVREYTSDRHGTLLSAVCVLI